MVLSCSLLAARVSPPLTSIVLVASLTCDHFRCHCITGIHRRPRLLSGKSGVVQDTHAVKGSCHSHELCIRQYYVYLFPVLWWGYVRVLCASMSDCSQCMVKLCSRVVRKYVRLLDVCLLYQICQLGLSGRFMSCWLLACIMYFRCSIYERVDCSLYHTIGQTHVNFWFASLQGLFFGLSLLSFKDAQSLFFSTLQSQCQAHCLLSDHLHLLWFWFVCPSICELPF
jgi:hypothetical protein